MTKSEWAASFDDYRFFTTVCLKAKNNELRLRKRELNYGGKGDTAKNKTGWQTLAPLDHTKTRT